MFECEVNVLTGWRIFVLSDDALADHAAQAARSLGADVSDSLNLGVNGSTHVAVLLDVEIDADAIATTVLPLLESWLPRPLVLGMSTRANPIAMSMLRAGRLDGLIGRPPSLHELQFWSTVRSSPGVALRFAARQGVGRVHLATAQEIVRQSMLWQALNSAGGNRRLAARTLGVSRRQIQLLIAAGRIWSPPSATLLSYPDT